MGGAGANGGNGGAAVELGIPSGRAFREQLEALRRPTCIVPCSDRARWIEPRLFCIVRCHGWRPSGGWRDPVVVRFEDMAARIPCGKSLTPAVPPAYGKSRRGIPAP